MYSERPHPYLPPLSLPGPDIRFPRLASTASSTSPPLSASGTPPASAVPQRMPHFQEGSPPQPTVASISGVDLLADLAGMAPPAKAYHGPATRRGPTSPLTLPSPTFRLPSPAMLEKGPRWTQPEESGPVTAPRAGKLQPHYPWVTTPLPPRLPLPALRTNFVNTGGDVDAQFYASGWEDKEAGRADPTSPVTGEKDGFGPEYVQQRRQFWSTVLGDIAGSSQLKDESIYDASEMATAAPSPLDAAPPAPSPLAERESSKSVEDYAAHGGATAQFGNLGQLSHQEHGSAVADGAARKQMFEGADDQSTSWKKEAPVYAATWCGTSSAPQENSGGGGNGGGSGTGSDPPTPAAQRAHACSLCQHRFKRVCDLKKHKAAVHAKLRPFACKQCGKTFGQAGTRSKHYRTVHVGLKPHRCNVCQRTFSEKGNMRKHMLRVHQISSPQP